MAIVLSRIDNRLIHGQVIESWLPQVNADAIVVANDAVARDPMKSTLMQMAVPSDIRVEIVPLEQLKQCLQGVVGTHAVMILFATTEDAHKAYDEGVRFADLNLGNLHRKQGKVRYSCTVCLDETDMKHLTALTQKGVNVVAQSVPGDREMALEDLCRCEVDFQ